MKKLIDITRFSDVYGRVLISKDIRNTYGYNVKWVDIWLDGEDIIVDKLGEGMPIGTAISMHEKGRIIIPSEIRGMLNLTDENIRKVPVKIYFDDVSKNLTIRVNSRVCMVCGEEVQDKSIKIAGNQLCFECAEFISNRYKEKTNGKSKT